MHRIPRLKVSLVACYVVCEREFLREVAPIDLFHEKRQSDVWGWGGGGVLDPDISSVSKSGKIDSLLIISNRFKKKRFIPS